MELSKLNISSIAKEEIRRRFFDSRSLKNKTSSDSLDTLHKQPDADLETSKKDISEKVEKIVPQIEEETSGCEDDGLPLITSVFSLALPNSGAADKGCVSTDKVGASSDGIMNTAGTPQSIACTAVPLSGISSCNQGNLPFVVKCSPNGVITVCSPPNPSSSSFMFGEEHKDATTITSSLKGSVCSIESSDMTPVKANQQMFLGNTADTNTGLIPNMVTFIDATQPTVVPVEKPPSEVKNNLATSKLESLSNDDTVCLPHDERNQLQTAVSSQEIKDGQSSQTVNTNFPESVKTSSVLSSTLNATNDQTSLAPTELGWTDEENSDVIDLNTTQYTLNHDIPMHELSIEKDCIDQLVPTKQEEKIRHLKDLLRQKEAELERFRFKGKVASGSAAAQIRANFLKKNPSLCRRSQRLNTNKIGEPHSQISTAFSGEKNSERSKCDKNNLTVKKKKDNFELHMSKMKVSDNADVNVSSSSSKQKNTKFTDEEKYKLVNVTVVQGHTRTLAVPLHHENTAQVSVTTNVPNKPNFSSEVTETATRKRKQRMPRKIGSSPSKRNFKGEEHEASETNSVQSRPSKPVPLTTDSAITHCESSPKGINTRSSPRRKKGHQSLQSTSLKRKLLSTDELDIQNRSSASGKLPKGKSSLVSLKAGLTFSKPKEILSTKRASNTATTSKSNVTINLKDSKQVTTSDSASGRKVAYVLHVNGAGATTDMTSNFPTSNVSNEDIVKRVVESMPKEVFALVGKVPGDGTECKTNSKFNDIPVTTPLPGTNLVLHHSPVGISHQRKETTPSATDISGAPSSCKVSVPTLHIPSVDAKHNKIQTEVAKIDISKLDIPVSISSVDNQTVTTTSKLTQYSPILSPQNDQVVQNIQSESTVSNDHLTTPSIKGIATDQPNTSCENAIVSGTDGGTSIITSPYVSIPVTLGATTVATANMLKPLTVSTRAPEVESVTSTGERKLALKPKYTLSVPFAIANSLTNTSNVLNSPILNMANINPPSLPIVPILTSSPNTPHRLLAPKPTSILRTLPTLISPKPVASQNIKPETASSIAPHSASSPTVAAKPTSTQYKLPKNVVLPPQNIAARSTTFAPFNQVINILPKPVMTVPTSSPSSLPENLSNGNILVYDVVQSNLAQVGQSTPLASKDAAKLVVYVSKTGDTRNLGIIKDKKIYLNSNQVPAVTHQPNFKSSETTEFIPNPHDGDFKVLLGLEHVVNLLTKD